MSCTSRVSSAGVAAGAPVGSGASVTAVSPAGLLAAGFDSAPPAGGAPALVDAAGVPPPHAATKTSASASSPEKSSLRITMVPPVASRANNMGILLGRGFGKTPLALRWVLGGGGWGRGAQPRAPTPTRLLSCHEPSLKKHRPTTSTRVGQCLSAMANAGRRAYVL